MRRSIDPAFTELLTASLLVMLPAHRDHGLSQEQARQRLESAVIAASDGDASTASYLWPDACLQLLSQAAEAAGLAPGNGLTKATFDAATAAVWPLRHRWQERADIGDGLAA